MAVTAQWDLINVLILLATSLGGVAGVFGALAIIEKFFKESGLIKAIRRLFVGHLEDTLGELDDRLQTMELWQLRWIIDDRRAPLEDRITAGDAYIARGGNGVYKTKIDVLRKEYAIFLQENAA